MTIEFCFIYLEELKKASCLHEIQSKPKKKKSVQSVVILYQAGTKLETLESTSVPMPAILLRVPWRHQTVIVSK